MEDAAIDEGMRGIRIIVDEGIIGIGYPRRHYRPNGLVRLLELPIGQLVTQTAMSAYNYLLLLFLERHGRGDEDVVGIE